MSAFLQFWSKHLTHIMIYTICKKLIIWNILFYRSYRYAAYRQFTWWVHNRLGRGVRRRIPACVINKIREEFPEPDGIYVGFKDGKQTSEIDFSWVFRLDENEEI